METQKTISEENLGNQREELINNEDNYLQSNLDYISNQIKYLGFGEGFNEALKEAIQSGNEKIDFPISKEFSSSPEESNSIDFTLHFNKGKESNMYFLNSYSAQLNTPGMDPKDVRSQTFYLNKGKGFTAKEAFNLLSDRSVNKDLTNKEGVSYNAWVKLKPAENNEEKENRDFQVFNENYGYDLKESLSKFPIKEMETPEAEARLMNSLKKGNLQSVTFSGIDGDDKKYIEAVPQYKNINVYNEEGKKQFITQSFNEQEERIFSPAAPAHDISMKDLTPADELAIKTEAQNAVAQGKNFSVIDTSFNRSNIPCERIQYFSNEQQARESALLKGNNLVDTKSLTLSGIHKTVRLLPGEATEISNRAAQYSEDGFKYAVIDASISFKAADADRIQFFPSLIQAAKAATGKDAYLIKTDELGQSLTYNKILGKALPANSIEETQNQSETIKTANEPNQTEDQKPELSKLRDSYESKGYHEAPKNAVLNEQFNDMGKEDKIAANDQTTPKIGQNENEKKTLPETTKLSIEDIKETDTHERDTTTEKVTMSFLKR